MDNSIMWIWKGNKFLNIKSNYMGHARWIISSIIGSNPMTRKLYYANRQRLLIVESMMILTDEDTPQNKHSDANDI